MMGGKFLLAGACGMGMAPLAAFLKDGGAQVVAFDDAPDPAVKRALEEYGIRFLDPHGLQNPVDAEYLVYSTALKNDLARFRAAAKFKGEMPRGECWARICATRKLVSVVGSHGKSSVSALISHAARKESDDFGHMVGAIPNAFPMHKFCAEGKILVSETDESDGTIEHFFPEVCVALNADLDHTNTYPDFDALKNMFRRLFARTNRAIVYNACDPVLEQLAAESGKPAYAAGTHETAELGFMALNEAIARKAYEVAFQKPLAPDAFCDYSGLKRRQETLLSTPNVWVVADYAHHPNEVGAFLKWFAQQSRARNLKRALIAFQPHRFTRTRRFAETFARILEAHASPNFEITVLPVYAASEPFDPLGTSREILKYTKSPSIVLAKNEDFLKMASAKIAGASPEKTAQTPSEAGCENGVAVAVVGAGDFYFQAKNFFQKI